MVGGWIWIRWEVQCSNVSFNIVVRIARPEADHTRRNPLLGGCFFLRVAQIPSTCELRSNGHKRSVRCLSYLVYADYDEDFSCWKCWAQIHVQFPDQTRELLTPR